MMDRRDREREKERDKGRGRRRSSYFGLFSYAKNIGASAHRVLRCLSLIFSSIPGYVGVAVGHVALDVQGIWVIKKSRNSDLWQWPNRIGDQGSGGDRRATN